MAKNKKELAELVIRLWDNIDQADQGPDMIELFNHLDNAYLLYLIQDFRDAVKSNIDLNKYELLFSDEADLEDMLEEARKALGKPKEDD
jgi:hypothetical protein